MSVLDGPRVELRRILHEGVAYWVRPEAPELALVDGRPVLEAFGFSPTPHGAPLPWTSGP